MPESLKPYDPNKSWIEWKLDPNYIIDQLGNLIPWRHTIGLMDSETPWSEVGKSAVRETPILGSLLAGEPTDALKEAFLFGFPVKAGVTKKQLNKLPKTTQFRQEGVNSIRAYDPKSGNSWKVWFDDDGKGTVHKDYSYNPANFTASNKPAYNLSQINEFIDNTNAAFNKVPDIDSRNAVGLANSDIGYYCSPMSEVFKYEANGEPIYNPLGSRIDAYDDIKRLIDNASKAKPRKGESVKVVNFHDNGDITSAIKLVKSNNTARWPGSNEIDKLYPRRGITDNYYTTVVDVPNKQLFEYDNKLLQDEIRRRNIRSYFEDDVIPYKNAEQYYNDYWKAYNEYKDAVYGPFLEDVLGRSR